MKMNNPGFLIKEFLYRIYDDILLWKYRREVQKLSESIEHQLVTRKAVKKKIAEIEDYYNLLRD